MIWKNYGLPKRPPSRDLLSPRLPEEGEREVESEESEEGVTSIAAEGVGVRLYFKAIAEYSVGVTSGVGSW